MRTPRPQLVGWWSKVALSGPPHGAQADDRSPPLTEAGVTGEYENTEFYGGNELFLNRTDSSCSWEEKGHCSRRDRRGSDHVQGPREVTPGTISGRRGTLVPSVPPHALERLSKLS